MGAFWQPTGKTAALLGFGLSNQTLLDYLLTCGLSVTLRDRKPISPQMARGLPTITGDGYLLGLTEDLLFRSPGLRPDLPPLTAAVAHGARLLGEYDLFAALCPATMLGVTGSDGKTTTTTIAGHMLHAAGHTAYIGGNIGTPLIASLPAMQAGEIALAELSSFQLITAPRPPHRAVITNITENHLNWHQDMAEYVAAKANILGPATHAVLNAENPYTAAMARRRADKTLFSIHRGSRALRAAFGPCHTVTLESGMLTYDEKPLFPAADILLPGQHNKENYLAAIGLVYPYVAPAHMQAVARRFGGVPHRMEYVGDLHGVSYYNSSIDSTPSRTAATLAALGKKPILLCGGRGKGLSPAPLCRAAATYAAAVILFGEAGPALQEALRPLPIPLRLCPTMQDAIATAKAMAQPGDSILLSPACTSFDEFENFEKRGEAFRRAVSVE